ncbi:MAG: hypothetical protein Q8R15_03335 [Candidatus Micrarchaeota archaeon]|nr:hypothetical protein [Candidatus Micrarchaeota archaeon]
MDFTFIFLTILMVFAAQAGMLWIAVGLFLILLLSAKTKLLLLAAGISGVLLALITLGIAANNYLIIGGLFVMFLIIIKKDADSPQPDPMAAYGGYGG